MYDPLKPGGLTKTNSRNFQDSPQKLYSIQINSPIKLLLVERLDRNSLFNQNQKQKRNMSFDSPAQKRDFLYEQVDKTATKARDNMKSNKSITELTN